MKQEERMLQRQQTVATDVKDTEWVGKAFANAMVDHTVYQNVLGAMLVANGLFIGIQADYQARRETKDTDLPFIFPIINWFFLVYFSFEVTTRLWAYGLGFWYKEGWRWNTSDFIVVAFTWVDEIIVLMGRIISIDEDSPTIPGPLRLLRLGRIFRLARMVRSFPNLRALIGLVFVSMNSFLWTMVLMVVAMYIVAVVFISDLVEDAEKWTERDRVEAYASWGSFYRGMVSCFMAITGGADWRAFVVVYTRNNGYTKLFVFMLFIAFSTLVMLNLITGVFVDGFQKILKEDKEDEMVVIAGNLLQSYGEDVMEILSQEDFSVLINSGVFDENIALLGLDPKDQHLLFRIIRAENNGQLTLAQYVEGCLKSVESAKHADVAYAKYALMGEMDQLKEYVRAVDVKLDVIQLGIARVNDVLDE
jgi:hypothetical protein